MSALFVVLYLVEGRYFVTANYAMLLMYHAR